MLVSHTTAILVDCQEQGYPFLFALPEVKYNIHCIYLGITIVTFQLQLATISSYFVLFKCQQTKMAEFKETVAQKCCLHIQVILQWHQQKHSVSWAIFMTRMT